MPSTSLRCESRPSCVTNQCDGGFERGRKQPPAYRAGACPVPTVFVGLFLLFSACTSVDTILLTSDTFPPKESGDQVAVLNELPARPHRALAELRIGDSRLNFGHLQRRILDRAAALGADAVVFAEPDTQTLHQIAYEPAYDPWGYNSPYYGGPYGGPYGGWGQWSGLYSGNLAVPYDETVRMLMGTAIRYTDTVGAHGRGSSEDGRAQTYRPENHGRTQSPP